jgi:hypothetical protein
MQDQRVLDDLRVDVDATRDDHEGLAVREVKIAVRIDVADVAECGPIGMLRVLGGARFLRVLVIGEGHLVALEVDGAGFAGRKLAAFVVADVKNADGGAAHRARPLEPIFAVDARGAVALGTGVILVQDGSPPVDHLALDLDRAGRGCVDGDAVRGQIVP